MKTTQKTKWIIVDWANNRINFGDREREFGSFEVAENFLSDKLGSKYETDRQEYYIVTEKEWRDGGGK